MSANLGQRDVGSDNNGKQTEAAPVHDPTAVLANQATDRAEVAAARTKSPAMTAKVPAMLAAPQNVECLSQYSTRSSPKPGGEAKRGQVIEMVWLPGPDSNQRPTG